MTNNDNLNSWETKPTKWDSHVQIIAVIALAVVFIFAILIGAYRYNHIKDRPKDISEEPKLCQEDNNCTVPTTSPTKPTPNPSYPCPEYKGDCTKPLVPKTDTATISTPPNLHNNFPKQTSAWRDKYIDKVNTGVINKYNTVYLDLSKDENTHIIHTEIVDTPKIRYSWSDFKDIKSENFGAYYYGKLNFEKDVTKQIFISTQSGFARVFIDGLLVYNNQDKHNSSSNDRPILYNFTKGEHIIEVEYKNNWHTVEFYLDILDLREIERLNKVAKMIHSSLIDYDLYYVNNNGDAVKNFESKLDIQKNTKPIVLILYSYYPMQWNLSSDGEKNIRYVLVSSRQANSTVYSTNSNIEVIYIDSDDLDNAYSLEPNCYDKPPSERDDGYVNCENNTTLELFAEIKSAFNKDGDGVSGLYKSDVDQRNLVNLKVPEKVLTPTDWQNIIQTTNNKKAEILEKHRKNLNW